MDLQRLGKRAVLCSKSRGLSEMKSQVDENQIPSIGQNRSHENKLAVCGGSCACCALTNQRRPNAHRTRHLIRAGPKTNANLIRRLGLSAWELRHACFPSRQSASRAQGAAVLSQSPRDKLLLVWGNRPVIINSSGL